MNKSNIIEQFNSNIPKTELEVIELFDNLEYKDTNQIEYIKKLDKQIIKNFNTLKEKLEKCSIKVNTAIFGDKKFINESYAYEIPLNKEYFEDNVDIKFENNILTNNITKASKDNRKDLGIENITSKKNTLFNFKNKTLTIEKNTDYNYQEIQLNIPKTINSGIIYIEFNKYDNLSLLNKFGKEIVPKSITNFISHPISKDTESVIIRFNVNERKNLNIKSFYISENSFNLESEVFSKPIAIYQELENIGINTCDNYSDVNSDIKYEISINKGNYREIRPLNKQKNLDLNSILSVDDTITYYKLSDSLFEDNIRLYTTDHFKNETVNILKSFEFKLGEDLGIILKEEIFIYLEKDIEVFLNDNDIIFVDNIKIENKKDIKLKKGFHKLSVPQNTWNQTINLLKYEILKIDENLVTMKNKEDNSVVTKVLEDSEKNSLFLQLILKSSIFINELKEKPYYVNNKLYITKSVNADSHIFIKYKTNYVETIQLKITLKSLSKTNPVYLSSLTIRGI